MSFFNRTWRSALIAPFLVATAQAVSLDWSAVTWTAGSLSNSYDVDAARPGNEITLTVSGNTPQLTTELVAPNPMTPAITTDFQGGLATAPNSLCLADNLTNQRQAVTVIANFSAQWALGLQNVSLTLFDIDFSAASGNNYQHQLRGITAISADGVTLVAPTITTSINNTLSGSGLTQVVDGTASTVDTGAGSGNRNVIISFGATAIKSFTFAYGSRTGADPTYQHVGFSDITFTPVRELNPAWSAIGSCLIAAVLILRHSAKFRK
ncbi:MAG TPA: hypothetical protein VE086_10270 [Chthoniobacterales bacterium]|nr:hypothetical protein [Chthoniobacterales bacterium]